MISRRTIRKASRTQENLMHFLRQSEGLTIVEYAVAAGLVVVSVAFAFGVLGTSINAIIATVMSFL